MFRRVFSALVAVSVLIAAALPAAPTARAAALPSGIALNPYFPSMKAVSYTFTGTTTANSAVTATLNGRPVMDSKGETLLTAKSNGSGTFSFPITFDPNMLNSILFVGGGGYQYVYVTQDSIAPKAPVVFTRPQTTSDTSLVVSGTAEPDSTVTVKGGYGPVSTVAVHGVFSVKVPLKTDAANPLQVTATDAAGNVSPAANVAVIQTTDNSNTDKTPPATPAFTNKALVTAQKSFTVTGTAEVGSTVEVRSPLGTYHTTAGPDGSFSVTLNLSLNAYNEIDATATDQAGNASSKATETVAQDSTAPGAPVIGTKAQSTTDTSLLISGTAEAGSAVTVTGGAADATATAGGTAPKPGEKPAYGAFSVTVKLKKGVVNTLSATAADAAGNVSAACAGVAVTQEGPPPAPAVTTKAQQTADTEIAVTGTAQPDTTVTVTGGLAAVSVPADGSGSFSATVRLNPEMLNTLYAVETNADGIPGGAASVAIVQSASSVLLPPPSYTVTADARYTPYGPKKAFSFKASLDAGSIAVANARVLVVTTLATGKQTFDYFTPNGSASRQVFVDGTAVKSDLFLVGGEVTSVTPPATYGSAATVT